MHVQRKKPRTGPLRSHTLARSHSLDYKNSGQTGHPKPASRPDGPDCSFLHGKYRLVRPGRSRPGWYRNPTGRPPRRRTAIRPAAGSLPHGCTTAARRLCRKGRHSECDGLWEPRSAWARGLSNRAPAARKNRSRIQLRLYHVAASQNNTRFLHMQQPHHLFPPRTRPAYLSPIWSFRALRSTFQPSVWRFNSRRLKSAARPVTWSEARRVRFSPGRRLM